ncbi:MAG: hypothetical protein Crog4KO_16470 [Crocinitomicaceae bacterium]
MRSTLFIIFILNCVIANAQTDTLAEKEFTYVKKMGVNYLYDQLGVIETTADTTITCTIGLSNDSTAYFQSDTTFGIVGQFGPAHKLIGHWTINEDTLSIEYSQNYTLYPFSINGKPEPIIEELSSSIIMKFIIGQDFDSNEISFLTVIKEDDELIVYK